MVVIRKIGDPIVTDHQIEVTSRLGTASWWVAEEIPVAFVYNRRNYAVMLATPDNLEDFAIGFSLAERVVNQLSDIHEIEIRGQEGGVELHLQIDQEKLERLDIRQKRRNMVGRAGCGVCGLENAETFFEKLPPVAEEKVEIAPAALERAYREFEKEQILNERTKSVHAAAWATPEGEITCVREDIGRHNGLDKLLGALAQQQHDFSKGFVMISSRCSYELVEKSARLCVPALASLSGPSAFAIRKAEEANISLYCRAGETFAGV